MRLRTIFADWLTLTLLQAQSRDDLGTEEEDKEQRCRRCTTCAEGDVAEEIEWPEIAGKLGEESQH